MEILRIERTDENLIQAFVSVLEKYPHDIIILSKDYWDDLSSSKEEFKNLRWNHEYCIHAKTEDPEKFRYCEVSFSFIYGIAIVTSCRFNPWNTNTDATAERIIYLE